MKIGREDKGLSKDILEKNKFYEEYCSDLIVRKAIFLSLVEDRERSLEKQ